MSFASSGYASGNGKWKSSREKRREDEMDLQPFSCRDSKQYGSYGASNVLVCEAASNPVNSIQTLRFTFHSVTQSIMQSPCTFGNNIQQYKSIPFRRKKFLAWERQVSIFSWNLSVWESQKPRRSTDRSSCSPQMPVVRRLHWFEYEFRPWLRRPINQMRDERLAYLIWLDSLPRLNLVDSNLTTFFRQDSQKIQTKFRQGSAVCPLARVCLEGHTSCMIQTCKATDR